MSISLKELVCYLDSVLQPHKFKDYCPNGLQVEGKQLINKIVTGVTANQALIDHAIAVGADAILVHHGYFWRGESEVLTGIKYQRIKTLIKHDISLIAYHLPLDAHSELGNNVQLAKQLGLVIEGGLDASADPIGLIGRFATPVTPEQLSQLLSQKLAFAPLHVGEGKTQITRVAWCTGAAQSYIQKAIDLGVDAFISGEISENTVHTAVENQIHYFAAGHHATERGGVQALGEHLQRQFDIEHQFIDIPVPV